MPTEVDALLTTIRDKYETARREADFYGQMLAEIESATGAARPKPRTQTSRRRPVKAEVSASDAISRLLSGCKMGLPASEIIQYVATTHGHRPNSLRTTLYNLKKKGDIVQDEQGIYHDPSNLA